MRFESVPTLSIFGLFLTENFAPRAGDFVFLELLIVAWEDLPQMVILSTYWNIVDLWEGEYALYTFAMSVISIGYKVLVSFFSNEWR